MMLSFPKPLLVYQGANRAAAQREQAEDELSYMEDFEDVVYSNSNGRLRIFQT
jgi:hypothetical protein